MNPKFQSVIRCPETDCHGDIEITERTEEHAGQIVEGTMGCQSCGKEYRIRNGFPILLPESLDDEAEDLGEVG